MKNRTKNRQGRKWMKVYRDFIGPRDVVRFMDTFGQVSIGKYMLVSSFCLCGTKLEAK